MPFDDFNVKAYSAQFRRIGETMADAVVRLQVLHNDMERFPYYCTTTIAIAEEFAGNSGLELVGNEVSYG